MVLGGQETMGFMTTSNTKLKKAVRARQRETGERYTTALAHVRLQRSTSMKLIEIPFQKVETLTCEEFNSMAFRRLPAFTLLDKDDTSYVVRLSTPKTAKVLKIFGVRTTVETQDALNLYIGGSPNLLLHQLEASSDVLGTLKSYSMDGKLEAFARSAGGVGSWPQASLLPQKVDGSAFALTATPILINPNQAYLEVKVPTRQTVVPPCWLLVKDWWAEEMIGRGRSSR